MAANSRIRSKVTIGVFCLALAVVFALGVASGADAKKKHKRPAKLVGTELALDAVGPDGAQGHVSSPRSQCVSDRIVTLYMKESEGTFTTWGPVATAETHADGSWSAAQYAGHTLYTGEYHAVVQSKRMKRKRARTLDCADATSNEKSW